MSQAPFLTGSSFFVLVVAVDEANDENYDEVAERFLVLLHARAPGAVIQLVLSKIDLDMDGYERKKRWLKEKVDTTLRQWEDTAAEIQHNDVSDRENLTAETKPLLAILPEVMCVSSKDDPAFCKQMLRSTIFKVSKPNGMFPTVGQSIPASWNFLMKLLGSVLHPVGCQLQ